MKTMAKLAIGAVMATGLAVAAAAPANAARVSIGIGVPAYGYGPAPCYDAYGDPVVCAYPAYYGGPVFVGGYWGGGWWHGRYIARGTYGRNFEGRWHDRDFHR